METRHVQRKEPRQSPLPRLTERTSLILLVAATVLVYANSLRNAFTMDDDYYITGNPQVTDLSWRELFAPHRLSHVFRPLSFGTYALNWALEGAHPFGFHLVNLVLHAAVTVLLYFFLKSVLQALPHRTTIALVAAWLFALHPIHTEAVSSIAGRPELLAACFLLAACLFHFRDREIPALLCFLLAVLSKESAVAFLPLILVSDYVRGEWKSYGRYVRIGAASLLYVAALWEVNGGRFGEAGSSLDLLNNPLAGLSARWRILNAFRIAWKYVGLQLYPRVLSCDYSMSAITLYFDWRHTLPAAVAVAAVLGIWFWAIRRGRQGLVLAGGIYLAGFAATANVLIPIGTIMGERLAYLPSAGICLLAALGWTWFFASAGESYRRQTAALGILVAVLAAFGIRTVFRNKDWRDNETLFSAGVLASPGSAKMHRYKAKLYLDEDQPEKARAELQKAIAIYPDYWDALEDEGIVESKLGHYDASGRLLEKVFYATSIHSDTYDFRAVNLAVLYMETSHFDAALHLLNQDIARSPGYARAWSNRAVVYYQRGDMGDARSDVQRALRLDPGNFQAITLIRRLPAPAAIHSPTIAVAEPAK